MSSLIVDVVEVEEIKNHPNADRLELVRVKNWWVISGKGNWQVGQKGIYLPPDSVISEDLAEKWGITKYTSPLAKQCDGNRPSGQRIRATRLRGERSFGFLAQLEDQSLPVGTSMVESLGVTKYEPPTRTTDGDAASPISSFHAYTSIENIGNFPGVFQDGEEVVLTEKIHGCLEKNTIVTLYNGYAKRISEINTGDEIRSFDGEKYVPDRVVAVINQTPVSNWYELEFDNGQKLICTGCHRILTRNRGWVTAEDLNEDDDII